MFQPREGITGTTLPADHLLSLEEPAVACRRALLITAKQLSLMTCVGKPAPIVAEMFARMTAPRPGDLVFETGLPYRNEDDWYHGVGILLAPSREEWMTTDADWEAYRAEVLADGGEASDEDRATDRVFYIQYGPAAIDVCRWTNCEFLAIPDGMDWASPNWISRGVR
jgi:hypothetical protein